MDAANAERPMTITALENSARSLVARMRAGKHSAVETMTAFLDRIAAREADVRAFAYLNPAAALAAAERCDAALASGATPGPLHGLPVAVKDIIDTHDMPTEHGGEIYAGRRPTRDATIVQRLRTAGAIVLGKTVTAQYALFAPGPTRNPHDPGRTPGGSSSGSAAAVAAGFAPVALGTQTNGSVIRPASFCGVVGFKPSLGLLPRTGVLRHAALIDHPGVMARDVADAAFVVDAIAGEDPEDSLSRDLASPLCDAALDERTTPRLAVAFGPFASRVEAATLRALEALTAALPVPVDVIELGSEFEAAEPAQRVLMCAGAAESLGPDIDRAPDKVPESVLRIVREGQALSGTDVLAAWTRRDRLRVKMIKLTSQYDAVLTFAAPGPAPLASEGTGDPIFATLWTLIGAPAYSLPLLHSAEGLPIGVQAVAAPGRDLDLTRAAAWLMRANAT
jgi:Asp-tRNA(Asn)/Glu-tRNA(Gln) amidotransferase A subunit family amidase